MIQPLSVVDETCNFVDLTYVCQSYLSCTNDIFRPFCMGVILLDVCHSGMSVLFPQSYLPCTSDISKPFCIGVILLDACHSGMSVLFCPSYLSCTNDISKPFCMGVILLDACHSGMSVLFVRVISLAPMTFLSLLVYV